MNWQLMQYFYYLSVVQSYKGQPFPPVTFRVRSLRLSKFGVHHRPEFDVK
jgi:hypothetical protein